MKHDERKIVFNDFNEDNMYSNYYRKSKAK